MAQSGLELDQPGRPAPDDAPLRDGTLRRDEPGQPLGNLGIYFSNWRRRSLADTLEDSHRTVGAKRPSPCTHRVQYAAEAEQIAAVIHGLAFSLLWRHCFSSRSLGPGEEPGVERPPPRHCRPCSWR